VAGSPRTLSKSRRVFCWALYDWGNSAFATSVMVAFFPILFNRYWSVEVSGVRTTSRLMIANGMASLLLAVAMPLLGAIADQAGMRKRLLGVSASLGITATAALFWVSQGNWLTAAAVFVIASVGFAAGNVFYDAMLTDVAHRDHFDRVSAFGFALGYLGGGLLLALQAMVIARPHWFALPDADLAARLTFLTVALWWAVFSLPLFLFVPELRRRPDRSLRKAVVGGLSQLRDTFLRVRSLRPVLVFLLAYWLYIDGVNTLTKAAVDYGYKLGFRQQDLVLAILVVQFISFPSALAFGRLAEWIGTKWTLVSALAVYIAVTAWAGVMQHVGEFYALACAIGVGQGGIFSLSRSLFARLIPERQAAEFFGFYNLIGKFAAILGPLLVALATRSTGNPRAAVAAVLPMLLVGGLLLLWIPEDRKSAGEATR